MRKNPFDNPAFWRAMETENLDPRAREVFVDALAHGDTGRAIEQQEARGQQDLVNNSTLPTDGLKALEAIGVTIGTPVAGDPLFTNVTLPAGWKKVPTDHSMWSNLVDETGKVRARIFYKAAFYDRSAFIRREE